MLEVELVACEVVVEVTVESVLLVVTPLLVLAATVMVQTPLTSFESELQTHFPLLRIWLSLLEHDRQAIPLSG